MKPVFSAAMSATPYKADFYKKMGPENEKYKVDEALEKWLTALEKVVSVLQAFQETKQAKW